MANPGSNGQPQNEPADLTGGPPEDPTPPPPSSDDPAAPGSLRRAALRGSRLGALTGIAEQLGTSATTAVLARLLTPRDFGIVAVATVVVGLFSLLTRVGVTAALVARASVDEEVTSSAFWAATGLGLLATAATAITSPFLAAGMGTREAAPYIAVAALVIFLGLAANVPEALLLRRLQFRTIYAADAVGLVAYSGLALVLAFTTSLGPWAIVLGRVASAAARTVTIVAGAKWRPRFVFSLSTIRQDLRFNTGYLGNQATAYGAKNVDYWVVGRLASPDLLGTYYVAYVLPNLIRSRMTYLATDVMFPVWSRIRDRRDIVTSSYVEIIELISFVAFPVLLGISLLSSDVIRLFFGVRWGGAVTPLAILSMAATVEVVTQVATTIFMVDRKPGRSVVVNLSRLLVLCVGLVPAMRISGLSGVAWVVLASSLVSGLVTQYLLARALETSYFLSFRAVRPVLLPTAFMVVCVLVLRSSVADVGSIAVTALSVGLGGVAYLLSGYLLSRAAFLRALRQLRELSGIKPDRHRRTSRRAKNGA